MDSFDKKMKRIRDLVKEITMIIAVEKRMKIMKLSSYTGLYQYDLIFHPERLVHDIVGIYIYHIPTLSRICIIESVLELKEVKEHKTTVKKYIFHMHFQPERELTDKDLTGIINVLEEILKTVRRWR